MKISVCATRIDADRILSRLASTFIDCKWIVSEEPDETADLVYFFPYLQMAKYLNWNKTPTICWYTHLDFAQPEKVKIWEATAKVCDVRLTSALKYKKMLDQYGPTFIVTPPLDLSKFKPKS